VVALVTCGFIVLLVAAAAAVARHGGPVEFRQFGNGMLRFARPASVGNLAQRPLRCAPRVVRPRPWQFSAIVPPLAAKGVRPLDLSSLRIAGDWLQYGRRSLITYLAEGLDSRRLHGAVRVVAQLEQHRQSLLGFQFPEPARGQRPVRGGIIFGGIALGPRR